MGLYRTNQTGRGSIGQIRRRLSYRTGRTGRTSRTSRTSRTPLSIDLQLPPSCPARLSRPSAPSSPHTGIRKDAYGASTRKGCTADRSGLSRTSQTAPILSDESDKSDAAEYRLAAPSQLPRPALPPSTSSSAPILAPWRPPCRSRRERSRRPIGPIGPTRLIRQRALLIRQRALPIG